MHRCHAFPFALAGLFLFVAAIKAEIIEELEKHRDAELAELREKRHKAEAEKARKTAEQSAANADEAKVVILLYFTWKRALLRLFGDKGSIASVLHVLEKLMSYSEDLHHVSML